MGTMILKDSDAFGTIKRKESSPRSLASSLFEGPPLSPKSAANADVTRQRRSPAFSGGSYTDMLLQTEIQKTKALEQRIQDLEAKNKSLEAEITTLRSQLAAKK